MKNNLLTLTVLLLVGFFSYAQNNDTDKLSENNKELLEYLNERESKRKASVESFLRNNNNVPEFIYANGEIQSYLWKIIEGKPIYRSQDNVGAARATKTNQLMPGGSSNLDLDGSGITVGVWEVNIPQSNHVEFMNSGGTTSRVTMLDFTNQDGSTNESNHATHVIGTIAAKGDNSNSRGMAVNSSIRSFNSISDEAEMAAEAGDPTNPILLSNHSYGAIFGNLVPDNSWVLGAYVSNSRIIDVVARNNPYYLSVWSAGNDGFAVNPDPLHPAFDKLSFSSTSKNNLVIANANPTVIEQPVFSGNYVISNLVINNSSSEGPTDDLRIKPDLAADGTNLESSVPFNAYGILSGTSMAAPNTTGSLALLQQYYNQLHGNYMLAATLKGLVCHTAIDDNANVGPDPIFGWGFLNAKASADAIAGANSGEAVVDELTLDQGDTYTFTFTAQAGDKLSATICWTDMPGDAVLNSSGLNDQTPRLVNDLDLRLAKDGDTFFPWRLDLTGSGFSNSKGDNIRDNVERIDIDVPTSGMYTLTVSHKGTLEGDTGGPFDPQSQDFSLIITGNNLVLSVDENDLARNLSVYPNPSNGEFTISFQSNLNSNNNNVKVDVYDVQGRLVYDNTFANTSSVFKETIALDNAQPGIYMVNISEGNRTTSHKLVIK